MVKRFDAKSWRREAEPAVPRPESNPFPSDWYDPLPKRGQHGNETVRVRTDEPAELAYLAWGQRKLGEPQPPSRREGWMYWVALTGSPGLMAEGRRFSMAPGKLIIGHPDSLIGHVDRPGRACRILVWIWRTPPSSTALRPSKAAPLIIQLSPEQMRIIKRLHAQSRETIGEPGERSELQLRSIRLQLDLCLLDAKESPLEGDDSTLFKRALQYFREHVGDRRILSSAHQRLHISKSRLHALLTSRLGKPPRAVVHDLRMQWAREQLKGGGQSIKDVSYALGYRHTPDFSRAFKVHFQRPPSAMLGSLRKAPATTGQNGR